MEAQITFRIESTDRDAIQKIADTYDWSFSQAARTMIRLGLERAGQGKGEEDGKHFTARTT